MKRLLLITGLVLSLAIGTAYKSPAVDPLNLPTQFDHIMLAGADYLLSIQIKNSSGAVVDLTANTYAAQFRSAPAPAGVLFANLSTIIRVPTFSRYSTVTFRAYSGGGPPGFIVYSSLKTIPQPITTSYLPWLDIKLSKAQTKPLSGKSGLWDLRQIGPTGLVSYPMAGKIVVRPTVTQ